MTKNIISLGVGCGVGVYLKKFNIRQEAYPFDSLWCKNLTNLKHILSTDFHTLMNQSDHIKINKTDPNRIHHKYYDNLNDSFNATFAHHNILDPTVYESFNRRIHRFRKLKHTKNIFITFVLQIDQPQTNKMIQTDQMIQTYK